MNKFKPGDVLLHQDGHFYVVIASNSRMRIPADPQTLTNPRWAPCYLYQRLDETGLLQHEVFARDQREMEDGRFKLGHVINGVWHEGEPPADHSVDAFGYAAQAARFLNNKVVGSSDLRVTQIPRDPGKPRSARSLLNWPPLPTDDPLKDVRIDLPQAPPLTAWVDEAAEVNRGAWDRLKQNSAPDQSGASVGTELTGPLRK